MNSISKSNELELKLKTEEMQRIRTELDSLKKHLNEKEKFEKELLNNHQLSSSNFLFCSFNLSETVFFYIKIPIKKMKCGA
jgi:hypothetical protein